MFSRLKNALKKTRHSFKSKLQDVFLGKVDIDKRQALEELFFEADLGSEIVFELTDLIEPYLRKSTIDEEVIFTKIEDYLIEKLDSPPTSFQEAKPLVIFMVGINGSGKTTTTAKLAKQLQEENKSVLLIAADTFRAAAQKQLSILAEKIDCPIILGGEKQDPASVIFDGIQSGIAKGVDVILVDTAGRLHTKQDLMQELSKMARVAKKHIEAAPHETLLVVDATIGQNAIDQADIFHKHIPLTGIVLTKLDGTAKGGVLVAIKNKLNCPIKYVGTGESLDDLAPFVPKEFVKALLYEK
ncbi:MAG: Signal recognition particle receptor FtsY [Chlamydiae bacterium]|nr:Signal recognition particle receptor FtsY [Chlamydiota bacterium]